MPRMFLFVSSFLTASTGAVKYSYSSLHGINVTVHCINGYCTNTSNIHEVICCPELPLNLHITTFEIFGVFLAVVVCVVFGICAYRCYRKRVKDRRNGTTDSSPNQQVTVVMTTSATSPQPVVTIHPYSSPPPPYQQVVSGCPGTTTPSVDSGDDKSNQDAHTNIYVIPPPSYEEVVSGTLPGLLVLNRG
ncbi:uncharacterized protein LOC121366328 [Gigantopelta aegis]|uniref:uncharacterized protein LOC121366328 n=1 Tax=Gigantopelta aegis TaxID=1735272 RepID=UPI001B88AD48|nr:uncharacterized protein LOC121366328 [Gigantopelta aegis]